MGATADIIADLGGGGYPAAGCNFARNVLAESARLKQEQAQECVALGFGRLAKASQGIARSVQGQQSIGTLEPDERVIIGGIPLSCNSGTIAAKTCKSGPNAANET